MKKQIEQNVLFKKGQIIHTDNIVEKGAASLIPDAFLECCLEDGSTTYTESNCGTIGEIGEEVGPNHDHYKVNKNCRVQVMIFY